MTYENKAASRYADDAAILIKDSPTQVTRIREVRVDSFRGKEMQTAGPFEARIEPFRQNRVSVTFDEKGTGAAAAYILLSIAIPRGTLLVGDRITDSDGNTYVVTSPARYREGVLEVNIDLVG